MGLYNRIKSKLTCPKCNKILEWQSKDITYNGLTLANLFEDIVVKKGISGEIYTSCIDCDLWIEAKINNGKEEITKTCTLKQRDITLLESFS